MLRVDDLPAIMASILRQELDSMVRVIYLLNIDSISERKRLITQTLDGEKWTVTTTNGKSKKVTDKDMVELSNQLQGWTQSVYKFGCAFIHLSNYHNYNEVNLFACLTHQEQNDILEHLRYYHGGPLIDNPNLLELSSYFPRVLEKITGNLECYLQDLEANVVKN